jgi:hypothetical protein
MRSQMTRLAVAVLLVCFVLVSSPAAWAWPAAGPASTPVKESVAERLMDWLQSLIERHVTAHQSTAAPQVPHTQLKEGPQIDPNGQH